MVLAFVLSAACGGGGNGAPPEAPVRHGRVTIDGQERPYRVFVPPTLDRSRPAPLVLALHGGAAGVDDMVRTTGFDREALAGDFIVAYPEGTQRAWNAGKCCGSAPRRNPDDVGFLVKVLDQLEADYRVDRSRVFVTGVSNGAMMAYRLACERADRITGVGVVAGAVMVDDCRPSRAVSILEIRGTEDTLIPYLGGKPTAAEAEGAPPYPSAAQMVQGWAEVNGCPPPAPVKVDGPVTIEEWTGCRDGSAVSLVTVLGGGHLWFAPGLGPANGAVDATGTIWRFFSGLRPRS
ncbi:MAG TPA: PHB depolymerase family esterase [Acidimicrobiales bacterium]|nr:PHB depolymerase family esterase [Acidimicrobiales bacterium]